LDPLVQTNIPNNKKKKCEGSDRVADRLHDLSLFKDALDEAGP
jgi:hypothetical protein